MQRVDESDEGSATARDGRRAGAAPSSRTVRWTKPSEMAGPCGGWLAADGRYWPCRDLQHATTAVEIVDALHLVPKGDAMAHLEDLGWIHVFDSGSVMFTSPLNQAQMDTLFDLACAHPTMRRWAMIALDIETSGEDPDTVMRRHGVRVPT
jgi:hypothetical protein